MGKNRKDKHTWTLDVQEDENGDAVLQFPDDLMKKVGWREGDVLHWEDLGDGSWSLKRTESEEEIDDREWDDIMGNPHRERPAETLRVAITRETINDLHRLMQATDIEEVEMVVSHASGIGPSVSFSYRGVIDGTNYTNW